MFGSILLLYGFLVFVFVFVWDEGMQRIGLDRFWNGWLAAARFVCIADLRECVARVARFAVKA